MGQSRKFCCCIPTRIGVFILSILAFILGVVQAWACFVTLFRADDIFSNINQDVFDRIDVNPELDTPSRIIIGIYGGYSVLLAISAFVGFIGAIIRNRRLVGMFSFLLWISLVIAMGLGALSIWRAFRNRDWVEAKCLENKGLFGDNPSTDIVDSIRKTCHTAYTVTLVIVCVIFAIFLAILTFLGVIVARYKHQLDDEHLEKTSYGAGPYGVVGAKAEAGTYAPLLDAEKNYPSSHGHSQSHDAGYQTSYSQPAYS